MTISLFATAFLIGLLGSFHCIGMCGPIAMALPVSGVSGAAKWTGVLLYNFGRAITYALLGLLLGFAGKGFHLVGIQQWVSIGIGSMLLLGLFFGLGGRFESYTAKWTFFVTVKKQLGRLFATASLSNMFLIGLLNGLLPCGLVYIAIAGAIASTGPIAGATFMFAFGLGTIPAMLGVSIAGMFVSVKVRTGMRKVVPFVVAFMAVILIVRGLNLGIPYLSPKVTETGTAECCKRSNSSTSNH